MSEIGFDVPDYKKIRVIVDTDAACEADDPFAIAINPGCGHYKTIKAPIVANDTSSVEDPIGRLISETKIKRRTK